MAEPNLYAALVGRVFFSYYRKGDREVRFQRDDIVHAARALGDKLPKNLGDVIYSFRYRAALPERVRQCAPKGTQWIIRAAGRSRYRFVAATQVAVVPNPMISEVKVPDATPGIIAMYALDDEQALLAKVRYNRLVDVFTGVACYSLQSRLRTAVPDYGQTETDEVYVGIDRRGVHYVFPVQAKAGKDTLSVVQIEQDMAMCARRFPTLVCRPVSAQFMADDLIALFAFEETKDGVGILFEKHYRLVPPEELPPEELRKYRAREMDGPAD
jgi:hypothetical protein